MSKVRVDRLEDLNGDNGILVSDLNKVTESALRVLKPALTFPTVRDNGSPLQVGDIITNLTDGFEYKYTGSGWLSTDIAYLNEQFSDSSDPLKGSSLLGRGVVSVNSIYSLLSQSKKESLQFIVRGFNPNTTIGGGSFYWDSTRVKTQHNGGTIISPTVPWNGSTATLGAFLLGTGETAPAGTGCFVRVQESREISPEIFGAVPSFSTDVTPSFQAAVYAAVNGECILSANSYRVGPIKIKGFTRIKGKGRGTAVILADNSTDHLFTTYDPLVDLNIELVSFRINGNRTLQTVANDAIHLSSTAPSGVTLARHLIRDLWITNVKGNGIYMDTACRESLITGCNLSDCDAYGIYAAMSDSQISDCIVGRSGLSGVFVRQGIQLTNVKSWYSGRIDLVGRGFEIRDADNAKLINCWSQENSGHGFDVYASSGTIKGILLSGCTADSDNTTNSGKNAFNIVNAINSRFDCVSRTFVGSAGSPQNGMVLGNSTTDCEITLVSQGHLSRAMEANASVGNNIDVNGRRGRVRQISYSAALSNDPWSQETLRVPLTGNITINAPQKTPHGLTLRYIFNQDSTGGRIVTWDPIFVVNWAPNTAANKTNIIKFICDGTQWIQDSSVVGL